MVTPPKDVAMGIIKKNQLHSPSASGEQPNKKPQPPAHASEKRSDWPAPNPSTDWAGEGEDHHYTYQAIDESQAVDESDNWDWEAFLAGELPDRRQLDERRTQFRREGEQALIATAEAQAEAIRQEAFQTGYQEGLENAQHTIDELQDQLQHLLTAEATALQALVKDIGPLAMAVAEKLLKVELAADEGLIERLVRETIKKAGRDTKTLTIYVHPEQQADVQAALTEFPPENSHAEIVVEPDDTVDLGSCMVASDTGLIDARFSTQLLLLQKLLY
jgi:flagellar assembly protein FliH